MGGDASIDEIKEEISTWECRDKDTQPPETSNTLKESSSL